MEYADTKKKLQKKLMDKLALKNIHQVPSIDKVIVAIGTGSLHTRKWMKDFSEFEKNLALITGQKPSLVLSKKNISNFKLRSGMPIMLRVTLRGKKAYYFLQKVMSIVLPRVRDFSWLSVKSFDHAGNYSFGLQSYAIFPELHPDTITVPTWLQITISTTSNDKAHTKYMLQEMWFVFNA